MKATSIFFLLLTLFLSEAGFSQSNYYDVTAGEGFGLRFFGSDAYKISAGSSSEYLFGPVTDLSIKTSMAPWGTFPGRGWTWGAIGFPPIAAIGANGTMQLAGTFNAGSGAPWTTWAWANSIQLPNASVLRWSANANGWRFGVGQSTAGLYFLRSTADNNSAAPVFDMFITNGGDIGIGTTSPDQKLTVKGTVHATEVKVTTTVPGPDYVFEKSYNLPSLDEVRSYIDENKHLPEVPSAKEMEKNGINLSEMNMLLLKKMEEMTLYVLEQKQQIEDLKKEVAQLKAK